MLSMLQTLKSMLFGSKDNTQQEPIYPVEDWMQKAAESSGWDTGIANTFDANYRYMRAIQTAPDYDTPILNEAQKNNIMYDLVSSVGNNFNREYEVNEDITIVTESKDDKSELIIRIKISDFEKWASNSRIYGEKGFEGEILDLGGKYYVDLRTEISEAINQRHLHYQCVKEREEYIIKTYCTDHKLKSILE